MESILAAMWDFAWEPRFSFVSGGLIWISWMGIGRHARAAARKKLDE